MTRIGADGVKIDFYPTDKINTYDVIQNVIEAYGRGEIYYDNYRFAVVERIGKDNGVRMSIKKNMTSLSVERNTQELTTRLYMYGKDDLTISSVNGGKRTLTVKRVLRSTVFVRRTEIIVITMTPKS